MTNLKVRNFGAITEADIIVRKYNIFIGHTSSGKSTIAKLLAIFNNWQFWSIKNNDRQSFIKLLDKYNINFDFRENTIIEYTTSKYSWEISYNSFLTNYHDADLITLASSNDTLAFLSKFVEKKKDDKSLEPIMNTLRRFISEKDIKFAQIIQPALVGILYDKCTPVYIPAERLLISIFNNSIFTLLQAGASIPDCIKDFGSLYEKAKTESAKETIDILNMSVSFSINGDIVRLEDKNEELKLTQASSGIQSIIPLWVVLNQNISNNKEKQIFVIEEPELNLFPSTQHKLIEWIMQKMRRSNGSIVITTHSPYVLSTIDNLILAKEILKEKGRTRVYSRIKKLIPSMALIDFEEVSSYFFGNDGVVMNIRDSEMKSLGAQYIDDASNDLGHIFNELCMIDNEL